jgi:hypothetical protein
MTGLNGLGWQIHDHLKKYRPKMFQELKAQGRLKQTVETMQNKASSTMAFLEERGLYHHEAWKIVKDDVLLPSEEDVPNLGQSPQPYTAAIRQVVHASAPLFMSIHSLSQTSPATADASSLPPG